MNKKLFFACSLFIAMMFGACSQSDLSNEKIDEGATSSMVLQLDFEGVDNVGARAAQSTAIPTTSWDNISQVQFFLYDVTTKEIRFSAIASPTATPNKFIYPDVPVGNYKLVVVANANSDNIATSVNGGTSAESWTMWNVRQKSAADMVMKHKLGTFPSHSASLAPVNTPYKEPAEIFMGQATTDINIAAGSTVTPTVSLKREVSLMRIRIDAKAGGNDTSVYFDKDDASIAIYRLPKQMGILADNDGGVSATSVKTDVLSIHGATTFNTTNPTIGYGAGGIIIKDDFKLWRDIKVFPNNGGRANNGVDPADRADAARQYFIVISGKGKVGHKLADGTKLNTEATVYWTGVIKENFVPNQIREVNLTLRTGGTTTLPTEPTEYGDMEITVSTPVAWNSIIVDSSVNM